MHQITLFRDKKFKMFYGGNPTLHSLGAYSASILTPTAFRKSWIRHWFKCVWMYV